MATSFLDALLRLNAGNLPPLPDPAKPVGLPLNVAPPPVTTMPPGPAPALPPTAPAPPLDMNFVNQFAGAAPVAPTLQDPTTLDKLAAILGGIAGGPGFGLALREERDRPIREYQAQLERFQGRRAQGLEIATERQQREQERTQRRAEQQAEREFQQFIRRANFTDEQAILQARQAFDLQKLREQERIQDERDAAKARAETEKQRRSIENDLASKDGAPPSIAKEISEWRVGLRAELSTAAQKWQGLQARKAEAQLARLARIGAGGGIGGGQVMAQLANGQTVPASLVNRETGGVMFGGQSVPVVQYVGGNIPSRPQGPQPLPGEPGGPEGPFIPPEMLPGGIRMTTPTTMKRSAAKAKLVKAGYSSKEADRELDRLGIE